IFEMLLVGSHERHFRASFGHWVVSDLVVFLAQKSQASTPCSNKTPTAHCAQRYRTSYSFCSCDCFIALGRNCIYLSNGVDRCSSNWFMLRSICWGIALGSIGLARYPASASSARHLARCHRHLTLRCTRRPDSARSPVTTSRPWTSRVT